MDNFGYIYKIYDNKAVILTPTRGFITIRLRSDIQLGHRVYYNESDIIKQPGKQIYYLSSIAAILLISFVCIQLFLTSTSSTYGFVDVDINPSIDFAVDKDYVVLKSTAMNEDAKKILNSYEFKGHHLDDAINILLSKAEYYGYIKSSEKNTVIVSMAIAKSTDGSISVLEENKFESFINNIKALNKENIVKQTLKVSFDERNSAFKNGVSMGKYYMYLKAKERDSNLTIEDIKHISNEKLIEISGVLLYSANPPDNKISDSSSIKNENSTKSNGNIIPGKETNPSSREQSTTPQAGSSVQESGNPAVSPSVSTPNSSENSSASSSQAQAAATSKPKTVIYNFEKDSVKNYCISKGAKLKIMSNRHYDGSKSIMADIDYDGEITFNVNNICPGISAGKTITFHVWIPGNNLNEISPFIQDSNGSYFYNWNECHKMVKNTWNTLELKVPNGFKGPVKELGLKIITNGRFNANIYIDCISWPEN